MLLRGPRGGLCGHLCGVGPVGQPAAGLAAFWSGDPLRAAAGPPHRAGQACAPGAPSLPAGGAGRRPHPLGGGRLIRHVEDVRVHFAVRGDTGGAPGQRAVPADGPRPRRHGVAPAQPGGGLPRLPAGSHRGHGGGRPAGGGAVVLRLWPGLWRAVRPHAGVRLFLGVPPGEGEVLPGPAAPRPGGGGDVPAFRAAVPRAQPAGVGRRGQRPGVRTDGLHGGGGTLPAADVPGLFGGAPAKAVKLPCPRAGAVL